MERVKRFTKEVKIATMEYAKSMEEWEVIKDKKYPVPFKEKYAKLKFNIKIGKIRVFRCNIEEIKNEKILTFNKHAFINA